MLKHFYSTLTNKGEVQTPSTEYIWMKKVRFLHNVFWADKGRDSDITIFMMLVSFDTTYLTKKYHMPFSHFVGVNHHGQSVLFGVGLLSDETTSTYIWLFETWL